MEMDPSKHHNLSDFDQQIKNITKKRHLSIFVDKINNLSYNFICSVSLVTIQGFLNDDTN